MLRSLVALVSALACASLSACSSEPIPPPVTGDSGCARFDAGPPGPGDAGARTVSRAEVDDIIARACSFTSCHGNPPGSGRLFLPKAPGNWVAEVVNKPSTAHPTMKRVVPGDPGSSFLVHKLTDGLCALDKECVGGSCGARMPDSSDPLPRADLEKIITWIREGAADK